MHGQPLIPFPGIPALRKGGPPHFAKNSLSVSSSVEFASMTSETPWLSVRAEHTDWSKLKIFTPLSPSVMLFPFRSLIVKLAFSHIGRKRIFQALLERAARDRKGNWGGKSTTRCFFPQSATDTDVGGICVHYVPPDEYQKRKHIKNCRSNRRRSKMKDVSLILPPTRSLSCCGESNLRKRITRPVPSSDRKSSFYLLLRLAFWNPPPLKLSQNVEGRRYVHNEFLWTGKTHLRISKFNSMRLFLERM